MLKHRMATVTCLEGEHNHGEMVSKVNTGANREVKKFEIAVVDI